MPGLAAWLASGAVGDATLIGKRFEIPLLDMDFRPHIRPAPFLWPVQAGRNPGFDLFPCIFGKKHAPVAERSLDLVQSLSSAQIAVPVHAKDEDVGHPVVSFDDVSDTLRLQSFAYAAKQGVAANPDLSALAADIREEPFE